MSVLLRTLIRAAMLVGCGWLVDRFFHTGWLLGVCTLSVIDRELAWLAGKSSSRS